MYFALYNTTTGALLSQGTLMVTPLPPGTAILELQGPPLDSEMWDTATRTFVPRPAKVLSDRLLDLLDDADFAAAWASLNATQRTRLRTALIRLLGRYRWRNANDTLELA
jgi:hypothetical protein